MHLLTLAALGSCSRYEFEPPPGTPSTDPPDIDTVDTATDFTRLTPWDCYARTLVDLQGDGREDYVGYEVYDPAARDLLLREEHDVWDDGELEWVQDHEYDAQGREVREIEDDDGDGLADEITTWAWDDAGALVSEAFDSDGDGLDDEVWTWTRDGQGNIVVEEVDLDGDGVPDELREWIYVDGLVQTQLEDIDADGVVDQTYAYTYDADDRLITVEGDAYLAEYDWTGPSAYTRSIDEDGDGIVDEVIVLALDDRGLLLSQDLDLDGNGHFETGWRDVVYDEQLRFAAGQLYIDLDPEGLVDPDIWTYVYTFANATGPWYLERKVEHRSAWDGPVDSTYLATYDWVCP